MKEIMIFEKLPDTVEISGTRYPIRTDFRIGIQLEELLKNETMDEREKYEKMLLLYYPQIPNDLNEAIKKIMWFYRCGVEKEEPKEEKKERYKRYRSKEPSYSFVQDAKYIYSAFKEQYGIDLSEGEMHWWKFLSLFESLNDNTKMGKIMFYRQVSVSGMPKEQRAFYNEMKKLYQIRKDGQEKVTLEQRNNCWKEYVEKRLKESN